MMAEVKGPLTADDPRTVWLLKTHYLHPPDGLPYHLREDGGARENAYTKYKRVNPSWIFIDSVLHDLFSGRSSGFFVEAGALDGEYLSNTLRLERQYGWTGLLVEAEQESYAALKGKHRRAWSSPACLATKPFPHTAVLTAFREHDASAQWWDRGAARIEQNPQADSEGPGYKTFQTVQCFPLMSFFHALNVSTVHFFSLDVEGMEMDVLRSFPFDKVSVDVWAIEHISKKGNTSTFPSGETSEAANFEDPEFIDFMEHRGYYFFDVFCHHIPDYIFVRRDSDVFRLLAVPRSLWTRRGLCLHKTAWLREMQFDPRHHRDARHWPRLAYSGP